MAVKIIKGALFPGVRCDSAPEDSYIVGHKIKPDHELLKIPEEGHGTRLIGVKYYRHHIKDERPPNDTPDLYITLTMLVSEGCWYQRVWSEMAGEEVEILLQAPGDFIVWRPGLKHHWRSEESSTMLTVRWLIDKPVVVAVAGLPGSGKSELKARYAKDGYECFDDFKMDWPGNLKRAQAALAQGKSVFVTDIEFCGQKLRADLEAAFHPQRVEWVFFANDPLQCAKNVLYRFFVQHEHGSSWGEEVQKIQRLSADFQPRGDVRPVVKTPAF